MYGCIHIYLNTLYMIIEEYIKIDVYCQQDKYYIYRLNTFYERLFYKEPINKSIDNTAFIRTYIAKHKQERVTFMGLYMSA